MSLTKDVSRLLIIRPDILGFLSVPPLFLGLVNLSGDQRLFPQGPVNFLDENHPLHIDPSIFYAATTPQLELQLHPLRLWIHQPFTWHILFRPSLVGPVNF